MKISFLSKRVMLALGTITLSMSALQKAQSLSGEVNIGALIPAASSNLRDTRPQIQAAFDFGLEKFNEYLTRESAGWTLVLSSGNRLDPTVQSLMQFNNASINLILGPLTSANLEALSPRSRTNNQLLFSYGSTSPASSFRQADHVFRALPDDSNQVPVIINQMLSDDISFVIVVYRSEPWGDALNEEFSGQWMQDNSRLLGASVPYDKALRSVAEFRSIADTLQTRVQAAIENSGQSAVAVFAVGFEEIASLMEASASTASLGNVRWYGIDTHSVIVDNENARAFANEVQYTISQVAPDVNHSDYEAFKQHLASVTDEPASYAFAAVDTVRLLGLAIKEAGSVEASSVKAALPTVARDHQGLLGPSRLNAAGDRAAGSYEFKQVKGMDFIDLPMASGGTNSGNNVVQNTLLVAFLTATAAFLF